METTRIARTAMLPYGKQAIDEDDIQAVVDVLRSDFITQGPAIDRFERKVADYVGARYAVAFCNGTAALHAACFAAGVGPGDEVITTPITFLASSNCALYMGARPVFADIKLDTYNIDPDRLASAITAKTKAIIPVDFTGQPVEIDRITKIAQDHGLVVIQDAAHSLGATYSGRKVGQYADMTMFSFHPVKHVTSGEGGVIVTDNEHYYKQLQLFRSHGMTRDAALMQQNDGPWYYEMIELGYNFRMTDMQAALGASQMDKLDRFVQRRRAIAARYTEAFSSMEGLIVPYQHPNAESSWHLYILRWDEQQFIEGRNRAFQELRDRLIGVHVHYIPIYKQPYYRSLGYANVDCPNAEEYYNTALTLPLYPSMTDQDVEDVIDSVKEVAFTMKEM
ncbi:UDP-4-amino-4,6-dideoxy-N-acetyl-beta-L-altrosamine transaminase [Paenibacillus cellulosilyticus]|uniref:UDP-4-amino-4, 6-dideoxy-N-acetyl-beta-L-altrosamine transaminase n=1 Tax=Paenibacillus cellulosilyticus TaxID=375489 RepID=A0A2V2Z8B9_9BACL|nr:UDP-4-amino-4,6-dideoxy-N-acetyl-beta-L-altrosamine transaminase [Paenibacillus cellulosilyticus]PWW08341.1 UDP-4-amino-4,6-dideoxy-N-acetyl-beta-L-altrosamine transaminase [Paenibacillus cellulosilyticus]QKS47939.1 UDP-4-amino-4,6-dideoxy-N-acetyl-beta-L-altrosamine transaminase [Paenibacillus cellulosilyticus]